MIAGIRDRAVLARPWTKMRPASTSTRESPPSMIKGGETTFRNRVLR